MTTVTFHASNGRMDGVVVDGQVYIRPHGVGRLAPVRQRHIPVPRHIVRPHRLAVIPRQQRLKLVRNPAV